MAAMYSWSCKRSYKNGFVWHDLTEDDLILPAYRNEYVLKGSELFDACPPDRHHQSTSIYTRLQNPKQQQLQDHTLAPRSQESSPSSVGTVVREDELPLRMCGVSSSSGDPSPEKNPNSGWVNGSSPNLNGYTVYNRNRSSDASTQTENLTASMFTNSMMGGLDRLSEHPRPVGLRLNDKKYFSGSLIETQMHNEEGEIATKLKRSSSYNADRNYRAHDPAPEEGEHARSKCLPQTIKVTAGKQSKNETKRSHVSISPRASSDSLDCSQSPSIRKTKGSMMRSADGSARNGSSTRLDSIKKGKAMKIEERLTSGARVIIQSRPTNGDIRSCTRS